MKITIIIVLIGLFYQGFAYAGRINKRELNESINEYNQTIKQNSKDYEAYFNRGVAYYKKGDLKKAEADLSQAIELKPDHANAYYERAGVYYYKNEYSKALSDANKAKDLGLPINPRFIKMIQEAAAKASETK